MTTSGFDDRRVMAFLRPWMDHPWRPDPRHAPAGVLVKVFQCMTLAMLWDLPDDHPDAGADHPCRAHADLPFILWRNMTDHPLEMPRRRPFEDYLHAAARLEARRRDTVWRRISLNMAPIPGIEFVMADVCGHGDRATAIRQAAAHEAAAHEAAAHEAAAHEAAAHEAATAL